MVNFNTYSSAVVTGGPTLQVGDIFNFDQSLFTNNIEYSNGIFTIQDSGIYLVAWRFVFLNEGTTQGSGFFFSASVIVNNKIISIGSGRQLGNIDPLGLQTFSTAINLCAGDKIGLYNTSQVTIQLQSVVGNSAVFSIARIG